MAEMKVYLSVDSEAVQAVLREAETALAEVKKERDQLLDRIARIAKPDAESAVIAAIKAAEYKYRGDTWSVTDLIPTRVIAQAAIRAIRDMPPLSVPFPSYQERVAAAHHALFHDDPTDIEERRARFAEEVNETLQALGMSREDMHRLVDYSWDRPVGDPAKEIGAALLTLTSLCVVAGYDLMACGEADLEKLQRPETIARIRAKRSTRHGRGPLPGVDPAAATEGSADE